MKKLATVTIPRFAILLTIALISSLAVFAQKPMPGSSEGSQRGPEGGPGSQPSMDNVPPPVLKGKDPKPEPAQKAIMALFNQYEVVGMDVGHGMKDLGDFIFALVRNPEFPDRVQDVAVECGNSLFQPILDRYIAGEDVPVTEVQPVWRNTSQPACSMSAFYEEFFPLVRQINQKLPAGKKLRVLAGDPPIDWSKPQERGRGMGRDESIASVMEKEVLSKHRKALMLFGTGHLFHSFPRSAVAIYEKEYPGKTFIISDHHGFGLLTPLSKYNGELEKHLADWPVPSLATIKDTWLANLSFPYFFPAPGNGAQEMPSISQSADGYLYLGPSDLLLYDHIPANIIMDKAYMDELDQRGGGMYGTTEKEVEKSNPSLIETAIDRFMQSYASKGSGPKGDMRKK